MKKGKIRNSIFVCLLAFALVAVSVFNVPKVDAAIDYDASDTVGYDANKLQVLYMKYTNNTSDVEYDESRTIADAYDLCSKNQAAQYLDEKGKVVENYFFGGWFKDLGFLTEGKWKTEGYESDWEYERACSVKSADEIQGLETVYAKFVPAYVLSMKAQNKAEWVDDNGTPDNTADDVKRTTMRMISSVDSLEYYEVGFQVYVNNRDSQSIFTYTTFVYDQLLSEGKTYMPNVVFGSASKYFTTWNYTNIPEKGFDKIIYVQPYWITWDGTKVIGLAKNLHVIDGKEGYVNVPINFTMGENMTAAHASLDYTAIADDYEIYDVEKGRIFHKFDKTNATAKLYGEMDFEPSVTARGQSLVNIVINNDDILRNSTGKDLYACVRFKKKTNGTEIVIGDNSLITFEVKNEAISDAAENVSTSYSVWPVLY